MQDLTPCQYVPVSSKQKRPCTPFRNIRYCYPSKKILIFSSVYHPRQWMENIQWIRFYRWIVLKQYRHEDSRIIHRCHSCFRGDWIFILEWLTLTCQIPATCHYFKCVCWSPQLPVKTQARVLYNFPIFPAPCVLNCIGRWIFGIRGCQVSTKEDFMHWYTRYESEFCRDGGESKSWVKCCHYSSSGHFSLSDW